jgi:hypothetical protein
MRSKQIAYLGATILFGIVAVDLDARAGADVHGHVYAADTLQPLAGATIQLFFNCAGLFSDICEPEPSAISANDGSYDLVGVEAGSGHITVFFDTASSVNYLSVSQPLGVDDATSTDVDFYMEPGGIIEGIVTQAFDGSPIPNVVIQLLSAADHSTINYGTTSSSGEFAFIRLDPGSYIVATDQAAPYLDQYFSGHALAPPSQGPQLADTITLNDGQIVNAVNFSLVRGSGIEGTITDSLTGLPLPTGSVGIFNIFDANDLSGNSWFYLEGTIGANGHYMIDGLPSLPIRLGAFVENPYYNYTLVGCSSSTCDDVSDAAVYSPSTAALLNVDFTMFPGSVATGTVVRHADSKPLSGVLVEAFSNSLFLGHLTLATATTDSKGHYTLTNIGNSDFFVDTLNVHIDGGSYIDQVYNNQNCPQANCANVGDMLAASMGVPVTDVDFALDLGGTISGTVVDGGTGLGTLAAIWIYASDGSFSYSFTSNADGTFETTGLQPGNYYLSASLYVPYYQCIVYPGGNCDTNPGDPSLLGQPITIDSTNSVTGITITFPADELFKGTFE